MLELKEKRAIQEKVYEHTRKSGSQNKSSKQIGVSAATLSQIINENWELIDDKMWRKVGSQVGWSSNIEWQAASTKFLKRFTRFLGDAQANSLSSAIVAEAGSGKTFGVLNYARRHRNVYHLKCNEFWTKRYFLKKLLAALGKGNTGGSISDLVELIVSELHRQEKPLIILDEADKLNNKTLQFYITLYNELEDECGIVLMATNNLERKINQGVKNGWTGFNEIYSRLGRKFIEMPVNGLDDVLSFCQVNGIPKDVAREIFEKEEGDLRQVKRLATGWKLQQSRKQEKATA